MPKTRLEFWTEKLARNKKRDRQHLRALKSAGWTVLVVWECELSDVDTLILKLKAFLAP